MYKNIISTALHSVFEKYLALMKALAIYLILTITIHYINLSNMTEVGTKLEISNTFLFFILWLINTILYILTAISTHRILILGEKSIPTWGLYKLTERELSFFINGLLLGLIIGAIAALILTIGIIFGNTGLIVSGVLTGVILSIIISRLSLVFPAISVDKKIDFSDSWNYTKKYKLLIFVTVILFPVFFSLLLGLVYGSVIKLIEYVINYELHFLYPVLNIFITVFVISALSATYKLIIKENPKYFEVSNHEKETIKIRDIVTEHDQEHHKIVIHDKSNTTFEALKEKLKTQYFNLDISNIIIDKDTSWMIKSSQNYQSYVLLSHKADEYIIEIYQSEMIDFLDDFK